MSESESTNPRQPKIDAHDVLSRVLRRKDESDSGKPAERTERGEEPTGTGPQLNAYLDKLLAETDGNDPMLNEWSVDMTRLLADRLGERDFTPDGFVLTSELLAHDCRQGVSGLGATVGEPMPEEVIAGVPDGMYGLYASITAVDFARGAFGDEFADQVEAYRQHVSNEVKRDQ